MKKFFYTISLRVAIYSKSSFRNISAEVVSWLEISYSIQNFSISTNIPKKTGLMVEKTPKKDYDSSNNIKNISAYSFSGETISIFEKWLENSQKNIFIYVTNNF